VIAPTGGKVKVEQHHIPALGFRALTGVFDPLCELTGYGRSLRQRVVMLLALRPGERLLDFGCGTGSLLRSLSRQYHRNPLFGIDPDAAALRRARAKLAQRRVPITLYEASGTKLPFADASLDVVVSTLVFHHLETAEKRLALREIQRVLRPDGRFLLVDFGPPVNWVGKLIESILRLLPLPEVRTRQDNVRGRLPTFLRSAGFRVEVAAPRYRGLDFLLCHRRANGPEAA